jgi:hypothetical protein
MLAPQGRSKIAVQGVPVAVHCDIVVGEHLNRDHVSQRTFRRDSGYAGRDCFAVLIARLAEADGARDLGGDILVATGLLRPVDACHVNADPPAAGGNRRDVVLGIARFWPDHDAQGGWLAKPRRKALRLKFRVASGDIRRGVRLIRVKFPSFSLR